MTKHESQRDLIFAMLDAANDGDNKTSAAYAAKAKRAGPPDAIEHYVAHWFRLHAREGITPALRAWRDRQLAQQQAAKAEAAAQLQHGGGPAWPPRTLGNWGRHAW